MPDFHETETTEEELQIIIGTLCCMLAEDVPECRDGNGNPSPASIAAHMLETAKQHGVALDMASLSDLVEGAVEAHRAANRPSS